MATGKFFRLDPRAIWGLPPDRNNIDFYDSWLRLWHKAGMDLSSFLSHVGFGLALCLISYALTRLMIARVRIIDAPNERSSHTVPTPRSGGIAILITFFVGLAAVKLLGGDPALDQDFFWVFVGTALLIAVVSIFDDLAGLSFKAKLLTQIAAAIVVMSFGVVVDRLGLPGIGMVDLGLWGYPLTLIWIVCLTNAFNFMDGIDGLSGGTVVVAASFFAAITFLQGSTFVYLMSIVLVWSCLGFLILNWQPAKIFMGDSGSQFLGFVLAVLAVIAGKFDASHTSYMVMVLLFFHYIWDTAYTFIRRLKNGERVTDAHRSHLYQLMNRLGLSHVQVTLIYLSIGVLQGLGALALINLDGSLRMLVFLPFLALQIGLTITVTRRARQQGLIA
ncbi:MAG: UDP-phosphate alpha-N-acetylglucosaminyl 1-phosphate transferase [Rhodospirillaceae bacterium]|nr:MAG: UDP-phosphate alpha-N-acetylglucosaminyl 1-phosphate transferase [Rhodospirillaceae bacterium]